MRWNHTQSRYDNRDPFAYVLCFSMTMVVVVAMWWWYYKCNAGVSVNRIANTYANRAHTDVFKTVHRVKNAPLSTVTADWEFFFASSLLFFLPVNWTKYTIYVLYIKSPDQQQSRHSGHPHTLRFAIRSAMFMPVNRIVSQINQKLSVL